MVFSKLESGAKASLVKDDTEYKMVLPLIKWNFYFFPIYWKVRFGLEENGNHKNIDYLAINCFSIADTLAPSA